MFRERIRQAYSRLSPNKKKVADFLMEFHHDAAFMTASQLARHLNVDVATVVRFAQDIGYAGYPALAREVQSLVKGELKAAHEFAAGKAKAESLFVKIMLEERENIEQSLMNIPADTVQQVVAILKAAKNIYIIAQGEALDLARFFATRLRLQGLQVETVETAGAIRFARERGAKTVGLVSTHASPVAHVAESVILCPSKSMTPVLSFGSMASVMDAILQMIVLEQPDKAAEQQANFEQTYIELVKEQRENFVALEKDIARAG